jgi:hypothetical protein
MDPWIEACGLWDDFHHSLIMEIAGQLADAAPERYVVRTGKRTYQALVDSEDKATYPLPPDRRGAAVAASAAEEKPHVLRAFIEEEHREAFVEVYEIDPQKRLVTTIEVLSPSNKRPGTEGWNLYQRKRQSLLLGEASLVEIDLLRGGQRMPMLDPWPDSPYTLTVARVKKPYACLVWEGHFRRPLPAIPVPLSKPDPDISLALQPLVEMIYRRFRYERSIDYAAELTPPLSEDDAAWSREQVQARPGPR